MKILSSIPYSIHTLPLFKSYTEMSMIQTGNYKVAFQNWNKHLK